jgi:hypothetical protein
MPSIITWVDHDPIARERSLRILSQFQDRESRDELGLGAIRDSFADALFPGTSTIQTRLRYMLFVPWVYNDLEKKRTPSTTFGNRARQLEIALIDPLLENSEHGGVFGRVAGKSLKRLPSSVYWNGLGIWGIRKIPFSQDEYHRHIDQIYRHREASAGRYEKDGFPETKTLTWHPRLPEPPDGFPDKIEDLSFELQADEASFLLDCILKSQRQSLLAFLALNCQPADCQLPWHHPDVDRFPQEHKDLLCYAELFSTVMHGAAFLYNLMLAQKAERKEIEEVHRDNLDDWRTRLMKCPYIDLPLTTLWELISGRGHKITRRTKDFVTTWFDRVLSIRGDVDSDKHCRTLISARERQLKGARSRFNNSKARDQWKGYAGTNQMGFRWSNVKTLLSDLKVGLNRRGNAQS